MPPIKLSIFNECGCHNQYPFNFGELKEPEHYTSLSSSMIYISTVKSRGT